MSERVRHRHRTSSAVPVLVGLLACTAGGSDERPVQKVPAAAPVRARLTKVSGEVLVKAATGDDWAAARPGQELRENDKVRTAAGGFASIEFTNGSAVSLQEDALVAVAETRSRPGQQRSDLTILKGRVDAALEDAARQSLLLATPAATVHAGREIIFQ